MATSSIFIKEPEEIEAFIGAAETSEANPYRKTKGAPMYKVSADPDEIMIILELNEKSRETR